MMGTWETHQKVSGDRVSAISKTANAEIYFSIPDRFGLSLSMIICWILVTEMANY